MLLVYLFFDRYKNVLSCTNIDNPAESQFRNHFEKSDLVKNLAVWWFKKTALAFYTSCSTTATSWASFSLWSLSCASVGRGSYVRRYKKRVTRVMMNISMIIICWLSTAEQREGETIRIMCRLLQFSSRKCFRDFFLTGSTSLRREGRGAGDGSIQGQDVNDWCLQLTQYKY